LAENSKQFLDVVGMASLVLFNLGSHFGRVAVAILLVSMRVLWQDGAGRQW